MKTVFAQATPPGRSGVAIIRLSGPNALEICRLVTGDIPQARVAVLRDFKDGLGEVIDTGLVCVFPEPNSFTGEDVVEFHLHGSVAVLQSVQRILSEFPDCETAEPGEFTRRAFLNGKMDLTQVEGLGDLIEAETELQRKQARMVASGAFTEFVEKLRGSLVRALALLEAVIDFADEDVPEDVSDEVVTLLDFASGILEDEIEGHKFSERVRSGFEVAIVGAPNVGKSTLLNALAGRDAAITSVHAGTTRDIIEVRMDLKGIPVTLIDTAGVRETSDPVEKMGVARTLERSKGADLRVVLTASENDSRDLAILDEDILVRSKADLRRYPDGAVSGLTGFGVDALIDRVVARLEQMVMRASMSTRERHELAFLSARSSLQQARRSVLQGADNYDLASEDVRRAIGDLDSIVGRVDVEHLLDVIFANFCLGK